MARHFQIPDHFYQARQVQFSFPAIEEEKFKLESTASSGTKSSGTEINVVNGPVSTVLNMLEGKLGRPVINESNLKGSYDFAFKWEKGATPEEIARSFTEATGVELKPEKRKVLFSIVESKDDSVEP